MTEKSKLIWLYLLSGLFIAVNTYLLVNQKMWGAVAPLLLVILLIYFVALDKIVLLIAFLTPLAVNIMDREMGIGISLPTEPMMFGVMVFFVIKLLYDGKYDFRIIKHPITILMIVSLIWLLFTSITSEIPVVSFKFLLSRLWFVIPFYFFILVMFRQRKTIKQFLWLYSISLIVVVFYTLIRHISYGMGEKEGHWVMDPFYNDHTAYGAALAMFIPVVFGFFLNTKPVRPLRIFALGVFGLFIIALVFSYSRAAWLSVAGALIVLTLVLLKINFRWVLLTVVMLITLFFTFQDQIIDRLERNEQDSTTDLADHLRSISNITTDASNLERINRWQSALRMFRERPLWGWGPGTYQFLYAPYQRSKEKTIISTNAGDLGNAHSEYIGPLAETGLPGMLLIMAIFGYSVYTGLKVYKRSREKEIKILSLSVTLGLITYYIHGVLNNFLDTDKASVPVWGFIAILVALDLYHRYSSDQTLSE